MYEFPVIFLSHGAPDLLLSDHPVKKIWQRIGHRLPRPEGVIILSAHWLTSKATIGGAGSFSTIHDFTGFPSHLYDIEYPASGSRYLVADIKNLLEKKRISVEIDTRRGLDHGAWIPLMMLYPNADIPVASVSLPMGTDTNGLMEIGDSLAALRSRFLIICSGAVTHNLKELKRDGGEPEAWATKFTDWVKMHLAAGNWDELKNFRTAPYAMMAHPTDEHFLPIFIAGGAALGQKGHLLYESFSYGNLSLAAFAFAASQDDPIFGGTP